MSLLSFYYKLRGIPPHVCSKCVHFVISEDWQCLVRNADGEDVGSVIRQSYRWGLCKAFPNRVKDTYIEALKVICPEQLPEERDDMEYRTCETVRLVDYPGGYCKKYKALEV